MSAKNNCQQARPKTPPPRDQQAWKLYAEGKSERQVAQELGISQTTAHRAVLRVRKWMNAVVPEERGEMKGEERFYMVCAEHEVFLRMQREKAMRQFDRSCETVPVVKLKVKEYPEGGKADGPLVKEKCTERYAQRQYGRAPLLREARQASHEICVLGAGYVGQGNGSIAMTEPLDPYQLRRWEQAVQSRDRRIAELEAKAAQAGCISASAVHAECGPHSTSSSLENQALSRVHFADAHAPYAGDSEQAVSPSAETQVTSNAEDAMTSECGVYDEANRRSGAISGAQEIGTQNPPAQGEPPRGISCQLVPDSSTDKLAACPTEKRPRWSEQYRREALDYHCKIHGLPWADLNQATGIPDHARIAPKLCIERGYPYLIYIDWSIKPENPPPVDERKVIRLATWEY